MSEICGVNKYEMVVCYPRSNGGIGMGQRGVCALIIPLNISFASFNVSSGRKGSQPRVILLPRPPEPDEPDFSQFDAVVPAQQPSRRQHTCMALHRYLAGLKDDKVKETR